MGFSKASFAIERRWRLRWRAGACYIGVNSCFEQNISPDL